MRHSTPADLRPALAFAGLCLLAGCIAGPSSGAGGNAGGTVQNPRSKTGTETYKVPTCARVWSPALADSTWDCPDPKPPAPGSAG
jgi:hypothetical protein